ncbi:MAG TPA: restriction endonuclease subunit S [Candidatus Hydrogenedentes bacterium]|nr:restriction endonuclease subunit S [Candidatus Hydrogenedentota bacterium]
MAEAAVQVGKRAAYPAYKPSGVEWLGDIPQHWDVRRLKCVASINDEALSETTDPNYEFNYVDIGNVDAAKGIVATETCRFEDAPSRARRIVRDGDTIVSTVRTYLRAIAPISGTDSHLIVSTGFAVVRPRNVYAGYLAYALRAPFFVDTVVSRSTGVSYPAINAPEVGNIGVTIPPLPEQRAIAAFLDRETARIDGLIAKKQRQIELLQEKRAALISHAVTKGLDPTAPMKDSGIEWLGEIPAHWTVRRLKHAVFIRGGQVDPKNDEYGCMALIAPNHIESGTGRISSLETAEEQGAISGKYLFRKGDVLYSKIRPELTKACVAPQDGLCSADMYAIVARRGVLPTFVLYLLLSEAFTKLAVDESMRVAMPKINREDLGEIRWPFPPVTEQTEIVSRIDAQIRPIDLLLERIQASIYRLREYRTALISAAVTGKIDVREEGII